MMKNRFNQSEFGVSLLSLRQLKGPSSLWAKTKCIGCKNGLAPAMMVNVEGELSMAEHVSLTSSLISPWNHHEITIKSPWNHHEITIKSIISPASSVFLASAASRAPRGQPSLRRAESRQRHGHKPHSCGARRGTPCQIDGGVAADGEMQG